MFRFENQAILSWLIAVPFVAFFLHLYGVQLMKKMKSAFGTRLTPLLIASVSDRKRFWKNILQAVVVALMILALARPQAGEAQTEVKSEGIELMLVVDVSESMMAEDLKPNRLEQAKIELGRLVEKLPSHKIGIIAFAGTAVLLSPLTTDPAALKMYLDSLTTESVSSQGTFFAKALEEAEAAFERGGATPDPSARVTRVILLASDGEDNEQGALDAARKYVDKGIRIFSIAFGTETGAPIPQRDSLGFLKGYKKGPDNKDVVSKVNGEALKKLAEAGQGSFYHASFGGTQVNEIVEDINKLEKTEFESKFVTQYDEKFQDILWLALILALVELLLGERKAAPRIWRGRFEVGES